MEIQKFENNLSPIAKALTSPTVRNSNEDLIKNFVVKSLAKAYADTGFKINETDISYLATTLQFEIKNQVPNIRIEEIPIAINKGVYGEFGEYMGLSVVTFMNFIKKYMESESRKAEAKNLLQLSEPEKPIPTREETLLKIKEVIINAYQTYLEKGHYDDYGNFIYNQMDEMGMINIHLSKKQEIFDQAKQALLFKNNPENAINRTEFKSMSQTIELLNDQELGMKTIQTEAKKIALNYVFEQFKANNVEIKHLLNQEQAF